MPPMNTYQRSGSGAFSARSNTSTSSSGRRRPDPGGSPKARYEEYVALARASASTGDAVETENYYQHAEHYFRMAKERIEQGRP
jgi:hypothetical protein